MSVRSRWLALGALLCSPTAFAESGPLERAVGPALGEQVEKLLPSPVRDVARDALEQAREKARDAGADGELDGPFSLGAFDRRAPVVIHAGELEAVEESGRRVLVFRRDVEVSQATLKLRAERLTAIYPENGNQPSRLEASGGVVVREGTREAHCERIVYDRPGRKLDCIGGASLRDDDDRVAGESIAFDLARRSVHVGGGSELWFDPPESAAGEQGTRFAMPWLREESPVRVRAAKLDASDGPEGRRIHFEGDVEVEQKGGVLRAQQLEAIYPPGGKQPDRLLAQGEVSLTEGEREARCETAEYLRLENRVRCHGGVAIAKGDRLEGDLIDFEIGEEKLAVRGRTRLVVAPRQKLSATP